MDTNTGFRGLYKSGNLYMGETDILGLKIGVKLERGAITFANSRAGKGVSEIIPNLIRWQGNALVIDPKGEAAEATAEIREKMGQSVHVIDPFDSSRVASRFKSKLNVLDAVRVGTNREYTDIQAIADGLVMRNSPEAAFFDNGGLDIITGAIVDVLCDENPAMRNLPEMRGRLRDDFDNLVDRMQHNEAFGGLAKTAWGRIERSGEGPSSSFISTADDNTKWLDDPAMKSTLSESDFALSDLKTKPVTIFLVLDADLLDIHGRFLRLFVRAALNAMTQKVDGELKGRPCLFILDEFNALGFMNEIAKSAGLLPGMGVHLWPFLQDIGQLQDTYGEKKAETFIAGSDAVSFYGVSDPHTLDYLSHMLGVRRGEEGHSNIANMTAQEVKAHIYKPDEATVARRKICITSNNTIFSIAPRAFFDDPFYKKQKKSPDSLEDVGLSEDAKIIAGSLAIALVGLVVWVLINAF